MKVLFIDSVHPAIEEHLIELGFKCDHDYKSSSEALKQKLSDYEGLVLRSRIPIDKDLLSAASQLKFIARSGAGLENINCKEAEKRGIHLFSAPEGNRQAVGEHSTGMILSLFNKISLGDKEIRFGKWDRESNRGIELAGKTIGIIGYGNMGKSFAKCLAGFECTVLAYDKYKKDISDKYAYESNLETIQEKANIISFHTPYLPSTHHYLNNDFIAKMKHPFYVINTSRGKVIHTDELVKGLKSNKILGACLDVLEYEKSSFENMFDNNMPESFRYLVSSPKVLLSPHVAGWTVESYEKLSKVLAYKIGKLYNS